MNGRDILELKKKHDAIAYLPYEHKELGTRRVYFRSPSVFEYITYTKPDINASDKFNCVQECVIIVTDETGANEEDLDAFFEHLENASGGFVLSLYQNIIALCPLSNKETCTKMYLNAKKEQSLLINTVKLDMLMVFKDYRLIDDIDGFGFKKFISYVAMLEEAKGTQGLFISELVDNPTLMEPHVKEQVDKMLAANKIAKKKQKRPNFPANLHTADPRLTDPTIRNAVSAAQQALNAKLAQDAHNVRTGEKEFIDFDSENKETKREGF